jgi:hypothetical protein
MAGIAFHGHHGRRTIQIMTFGAPPHRRIAPLVAGVAEDTHVFALLGPGMPGLPADRRDAPQGLEGSSLGQGVTNRAVVGNDFS